MGQPPNIHYIFSRMGHHSAHSGYDQLVNYIDSTVVVPNMMYRFLDVLPERILAHIRRSAGAWYNSFALKQELQNIFAFILRSGSIFHFLYGEDGYHYAGYLNPKKTNKIVASFHMPPEKFLRITESIRHLKKLDAAIVLAPNQESLFKTIVKPERVHLIPHGIDTHFFKPATSNSRPVKNCLFVGTHLRDFAMLRLVMQELSSRDPEISFTAVTLQENFSWFKGLKNVQLFSGVSEQELLGLYRDAAVLLLPVKDCTACNSILEAMACGVPVVSTNVGGISMYVNDHAAALVEPGDSAGMAAAALEILNAPQRRWAMSQAAREKALEFDWARIAMQVRALYRHLLS